MRKLFLAILILASFYSQAQTNYIYTPPRYRWIAGKFDSTLHIPYGSTPSLRSGGSTLPGAVFYKTSDSSIYVYTGTQWRQISGSSGGTSTLSTVTAAGDSTDYRIVSNDSLKGNFGYYHGKVVIGDSVRSDKVAIFFGHSVVAGVGVSGYWQTYPWKTSELFGWKTLNRGIAGTTVRHHSSGDSCMLDRLPLIPTYSSTYDALFFNYDINDANASWGFDTTGYKTDFKRVIDTAQARGWPNNKIIVLTANYVDTSITNNYDRIRDYVSASYNTAISEGVVAIDMFHPFESGPASSGLADEDHPNTVGTDFISGLIAKKYPYAKKVGILESSTLWVKDSARITNGLRLGNDSASVDGVQPILTVNGRSYFSSKAYFNTKYDLGANSWLNIVAQTNKPGIYIKDGNPYTSNMYAGNLTQTSFGATASYHGLGVSIDQSSGFKLIGSGGNSYFINLSNLSIFGTSGVTTSDMDSTLKVKGSFHVTGNSKFDSPINYDRTITAGGTTGNQTINKPAGTVNIAAAGTTVTVTNSYCTTSSIVLCVLRTNDATATIKNVVPGSGSFVINLGAAATAEVSIGFIVTN